MPASALLFISSGGDLGGQQRPTVTPASVFCLHRLLGGLRVLVPLTLHTRLNTYSSKTSKRCTALQILDGSEVMVEKVQLAGLHLYLDPTSPRGSQGLCVASPAGDDECADASGELKCSIPCADMWCEAEGEAEMSTDPGLSDTQLSVMMCHDNVDVVLGNK
ncbi:unnamed protein product [Pleuronectes platessa]|uniref:Uncharacterized protein n=1 Tax=Pleuronectes platessa TaxID=8262 RepID=A0A9N7TUS9_PLEPL|nr:unnamed protein product [Pleuronectes platessa]